MLVIIVDIVKESRDPKRRIEKHWVSKDSCRSSKLQTAFYTINTRSILVYLKISSWSINRLTLSLSLAPILGIDISIFHAQKF